jgi:hypothetical protein
LRRVFENPYYTVSLDETGSFARLDRTAQPFPAIDDVTRANGELVAAVLAITGLNRLLVDLRNGPPGRNDPAFERATESIRQQLERIERVAILVRTAAGKLQAQRLSRTGARLQVFRDEREALEYLGA